MSDSLNDSMNNFRSLRYRSDFTHAAKLRRFTWEVVWLLAFRPTPRWALHGWRRFLLRSFGAQVGEGCRIAPSCRVWAPWHLVMGEFSALGDGVDCYSMGRITLGSKVTVSQRSFLCAGSHDIRSLSRPLITGPIVIEDHVWIAAECFVHPDVVIREGAVIGARSVVLKEMPSWSVCAGNPCRKIKDRVVKERHV
ncbi:putative colanic acid biosynthesis acetyltransferase [Hydrogenophaga sp.]|uniref:putative colanic acid biosynthesis acetyltransferase n=1 Tax=Hydrogenophaga sp. TaxID=1904254 RepID=UPI0027312752|nr:putative colanic acid biosynthesis acetyltransferase [Hydrogenophaga sp.]MDP2017086.1 putative colanic acid biosynthesis acetyltransferase [Hydrogenophaga sp.]MDP3164664.1 putative colanic acid biosynthesis acetyltransferase [Hydrogenophaga sp.]